MSKVSKDQLESAIGEMLNARELAERFNVSASHINYLIFKWGLKIITVQSVLDRDKDIIVELYIKHGVSSRDIAGKWEDEHPRLDRRSVTKALTRWGVNRRSVAQTVGIETITGSQVLNEPCIITGPRLMERRRGPAHVVMPLSQYIELKEKAGE